MNVAIFFISHFTSIMLGNAIATDVFSVVKTLGLLSFFKRQCCIK